MLETKSKIVNREVQVELGRNLEPSVECWFLEYLNKYASYITVNTVTRRLIGYGIPLSEWENFRFWLGISLMDRL
jgi:hypothetical protein